jgi:hypothetical protein
MAEAVYTLCALTSVACAVLLFRGYRATRTRLLFWSSLCFLGLAINNVLLLADAVFVTGLDLSLWRGATALLGMLVLLYGLTQEVR